MTRLRIVVKLLGIAAAVVLPFFFSVPASAEKPSFAGVWKGTSLCQIKDSPCHDEGAVYTVKTGATPDSFEFSGNKVVEGKSIFMGLLECKPGSESDSLTCRQNESEWTWKLQGDSMNGTLMYRGQLYRKIRLTRAK
jgi:hypothetical protein